MPNQRYTNFECSYGLVNIDAAQTAVIDDNNSNRSECDLYDLLLDNPHNFKYLTYEHNFGVLDGSLQVLDLDTFEQLIYPYVSKYMSDANGNFTEGTPKLTITFDVPQSSYGFTFKFSNDYPRELQLKVTNAQGLVTTSTVVIDNSTYFVDRELDNYVKVEITFTKALPYRHVKMYSFLFGSTFLFTEDEIANATLTLENDRICDKLSVNELDFTLVDKYDRYDFTKTTGMHKYLNRKQEIYAYEILNDETIFLGKYFLDSFSVNGKEIKLSCVSSIGLLDDIQFNDGEIYNGKRAGDIIEQIFEVANIIDDYTIDTETSNTLIYGTLKPMSCRDALREILFACGSTIDTYGDDEVLFIHKNSPLIVDRITRNQKLSTKVERDEYVYGVEVEYNTYSLSSDSSEILSDVYEAGEQTVYFDSPYSNIHITYAVSESSTPVTITPTVIKTYYVTFNVPAEGIITITGNSYEEHTLKALAKSSYVQPNENATIKSYKCSVCNSKSAKTRANDILYYLSNRLLFDIENLSTNIDIQNRVWIDNPEEYQNNFIGWYTSRNFNLTGGFTDKAQLRGYFFENIDYSYARSDNYELFAGSEGLL